jgi:hypothetical protein
MRFHLEHIHYTSRISFETVAQSADVERVRRTLEKWAGRCSFPRADTKPPCIYRAVPLGDSTTKWALMKVTYVGADLTRSEGNYLAHAAVATPEVLEALNWNAAWLTSMVPFVTDSPYRETDGTGQLAPLEVDVDPLEPYRLLRRLIESEGSENTQDWLCAVLQYLAQSNTEAPAIELPCTAIQESFGESEERGSLLKLATMHCLLPTPWQKLASFSLNESRPDRRFAIVSLTDGSGKVQPPSSIAFVTDAVELVRVGEDAQLKSLMEWLGRALRQTDINVLNTLTKVYFCVTAPPHRQPNTSDIARSVGQLARAPDAFDLPTLVELALQGTADFSRQQRAPQQLVDAVAALVSRVEGPVALRLVDHLVSSASQPDDNSRRESLRTWSPTIRTAVWRKSFEQRQLPGWVPSRIDAASRSDAIFALWATGQVAQLLDPRELVTAATQTARQLMTITFSPKRRHGQSLHELLAIAEEAKLSQPWQGHMARALIECLDLAGTLGSRVTLLDLTDPGLSLIALDLLSELQAPILRHGLPEYGDLSGLELHQRRSLASLLDALSRRSIRGWDVMKLDHELIDASVGRFAIDRDSARIRVPQFEEAVHRSYSMQVPLERRILGDLLTALPRLIQSLQPVHCALGLAAAYSAVVDDAAPWLWKAEARLAAEQANVCEWLESIPTHDLTAPFVLAQLVRCSERYDELSTKVRMRLNDLFRIIDPAKARVITEAMAPLVDRGPGGFWQRLFSRRST